MKKVLTFLSLTVLVACNKTGDLVPGGTKSASSSSYSSPGSLVGGSSGGTSANPGNGQTPAGQITAGEWNDLSHWSFWKELLQKEDYAQMPSYWSDRPTSRVSVNLKNLQGEILVDVPVSLLAADNTILWVSRTDNSGNAELFPLQGGGDQVDLGRLKVSINNSVFENIATFDNGVNNITIPADGRTERTMDIAFVVDATGSMGDELEYLKVELTDVLQEIRVRNPTVLINTGAVFYRDQGDDYITRKSDFTTHFDRTINFIKEQAADGGGDFPEAVQSALNESIHNLQWSSAATSRILFLVLDAPPHHNPEIVSEINNLIEAAAAKGIKIIPVTASGIDKETEFLMRFISILTNGTYVFITNDSGIGNDHLKPSVGPYDVEFLNKLMVRLIDKYAH